MGFLVVISEERAALSEACFLAPVVVVIRYVI